MKTISGDKPHRLDGAGRRYGHNHIPFELWLVCLTEAACLALVAWKSLAPS